MKRRNKKDSEKMARYSIYLAIISMLTLIPNVGFVTIGVISLSLVQVFVLPMIIVENNLKSATVISFMWGLMSWLAAMMRAAGFEIVFRNPLVSMLPRLLAGITAYLVFKLITKIVKKSTSRALTLMITLSILMIYLTFTNLTFENEAFTWTMRVIVALMIAGISFSVIKKSNEKDHRTSEFVTYAVTAMTIAAANTFFVLVSFATIAKSWIVNNYISGDYFDWLFGIVTGTGIGELFITALIGAPICLAVSTMFNNQFKNKTKKRTNK